MKFIAICALVGAAASTTTDIDVPEAAKA